MKNFSLIISLIIIIFASLSYAHPKTAIISVNGTIDYGMSGYITRNLNKTKFDKYILKIDTYGGLVDAALQIVNSINEVDKPVYAVITKKAWSAGALISLACDKIYIISGSSMGSATPIDQSGKQVSEKFVSALRAEFRTLAEKNNYPVSLSEAMVDKEIKIIKVKVGNKITYLTPNEIKEYKIKNNNVKISELNEFISDKKLLNLTAEECVETGFADKMYNSFNACLTGLNLNKNNYTELKMNWSENLVAFLQTSAVSTLLIIAAFLGILIEIKTPGVGIFGGIGIFAIVLLFWSKHAVGLAQYTEFLFIICGIVLLFIEIFFIPGLGWAGIPGAICFLLGLYLMFVPYVIPSKPWDFILLNNVMKIFISAAVITIISIIFILKYVETVPLFRNNILSRQQSSQEGYTVKEKNKDDLLNKEGYTLTKLRPSGKIIIENKRYHASTEGEFIEKAEKIKIIRYDSNDIVVEKV